MKASRMLLSLVAVLAALQATFPARAQEAAAPALQALAPGVYLRAGAMGDWAAAGQSAVANLGLVLGSRCAAVIDTGGSPRDGAAFKAAVARVTPLPVCYVINTHAHPDHVLGNQAFESPGTEFIGHARLPAALQSRGPFYLNALRRDLGSAEPPAHLVAPTRVVGDELVLDLGQRRLRVNAWPTSHTDADLSVYDEQTRVLFTGDLLFVGHAPVVDGKLKGWLSTLQALRGWDVAIAVPGHGTPPADWRAALATQQHYLTQLADDVRRALHDGLTMAQAVERIAPDRPEWRLLDVFHKRNVTAAYAELEWE